MAPTFSGTQPRHGSCMTAWTPFEAAGYLGMTVDTLMAVYGHHHPNFQKAAASFSGRKQRA